MNRPMKYQCMVFVLVASTSDIIQNEHDIIEVKKLVSLQSIGVNELVIL